MSPRIANVNTKQERPAAFSVRVRTTPFAANTLPFRGAQPLARGTSGGAE